VARKVVGLDIGTTAVRAAEVSVRRGQVVLERIGQAGLPGGAVADGEVVDPAAVAAAIKDLWRRTRISSRRVIIGVANQREVDQTELDHAVIGELEAVGGQRLLRVLLVAAQKEMLAGHLRAVRKAGLQPAGVDLNPIALLRSLGPVAGFGEGAEALVDVGARITNMVVHDNGVLRFVRILLMGGEDVTSTLERVLELDRDAAERAKLAASAGDEVDPEATPSSSRTTTRGPSWAPSPSTGSSPRSGGGRSGPRAAPATSRTTATTAGSSTPRPPTSRTSPRRPTGPASSPRSRTRPACRPRRPVR
jgi:type IV pilus assembly protein PilM